MLKSISLILFLLLNVGAVGAQVTSIANMVQNSMAPFQATVLPSNELDKSTASKELLPNSRRLNAYPNPNAYYLNVSNRSENYPEDKLSLQGMTTALFAQFDYVSYHDKWNHKIGGGVMKQELHFVQQVSLFSHYSLGLPLNDQWQLKGGLSYRISMSRLGVNTDGYQHLEDPKITQVLEINRSNYHSIGLSVAAVHQQRIYIGVGINRLLSNQGFVTASQADLTNRTSFTEWNLLVQWAVRKHYQSHFVRDRETGKKVEYPSRGLFSNVNLSVAARCIPISNYPLFLQWNARTTLWGPLWAGTGLNTSKRVQIQLGWVQFPIFRRDVESEYHIWIGYDLPTRNTPYQGYEVNLGYSF